MTTVGFIQFAPAFGDGASNLDAIGGFVRQAAGADLLVFPELAVSGYEFVDRAETLELGEAFGSGITCAFAAELARAHAVTLVIGYPEREGDRVYNACVLATPDGGLHNYRKLHLFDREKELFDPGDAPPPVIDTPAGRIGLMICFDWYFPETARLLALNGTQIIAHPSNLVLDKCQRAMFARSVENRVFTITANRYGTESRAGRVLTFTGASQILSPNGETLAQAPTEGDAIGVAEIDPSEANNKQVTARNDLLSDRRTDFYGPISE